MEENMVTADWTAKNKKRLFFFKISLIVLTVIDLFALIGAPLAQLYTITRETNPETTLAALFPQYIILTLISIFLRMLFCLKLLLPVPKNHRVGMLIFVGLQFLVQARGLYDLATDFSTYTAFGVARTVLSIFTGAYFILLIGLLAKKHTEKIAAVATLVWGLVDAGSRAYWFVHSILTAPAAVNRWAQFIGDLPVQLVSCLTPLVLAVPLAWLYACYPVLERPVWEKKKNASPAEERIEEPVEESV